MKIIETIKVQLKKTKVSKMPFFVNRSWQLLEKIQTYAGIWPYQRRVKKYTIRILHILTMISAIIPLAVRWKKEWGVNRRIVIENIIGVVIVLGAITKLIVACIYNEEMKKVYEKVNDHFKVITLESEAVILNNFSEDAMKFSTKYMIFCFMGGVPFLFLPLAKMLYDLLFNHSKFERIFPYNVDYGYFDQDKYYVLVILHIIVYWLAVLVTTYAYDCTLMITVRHICALFNIVKKRLREASELLKKFDHATMNLKTIDVKASELITEAIELQNEAFKMVSTIEEAYSFSFFIVLILNMLVFSGGVYILTLAVDNPLVFFRYSIAFFMLLAHFFLLFFQGQMIIDASSSIFDTCYDIKWYMASKKTKTLLFIIMVRSIKPCSITGGGLFSISMETFSTMLKAGLSYFSVFTR